MWCVCVTEWTYRPYVLQKTLAMCQARKHTFSITCTSGESANAVPHYQKLCNRDSHIWGIRMGISTAEVQWLRLTMGELPS